MQTLSLSKMNFSLPSLRHSTSLSLQVSRSPSSSVLSVRATRYLNGGGGGDWSEVES